MKKILSLFISVIFVFNLPVCVFAQDDVQLNSEHNSVEFVIPVYDSIEEYQNAREGNIELSFERASSRLYASVIRSGNTTDCELYLDWTGVEKYSNWRFKRFYIKSANLLFPDEVYAWLGNENENENYYTSRPVVATEVGSVKIGDFQLDSDIDYVTVECTALSGYNVDRGMWLSALLDSGFVEIK